MTLHPAPGAGGIAPIGGRVLFSAANGANIAQELGHSMGLRHAHCGSAPDIDSFLPYADCTIGACGYDHERNVLVYPQYYYDLMTYCEPAWVSDYSFD